MFIHNVVEYTRSNGPGQRAAVWFSGCTLRCTGCWNEETHAHGKGTDIEVVELSDRLLAIEGIEGITFSGGEPMQQAFRLYQLMSLIRSKRPEMSFGMYTGYTQRELEAGRFDEFFAGQMIPSYPMEWNRVKSHLDFAVMGRYNQLLRTSNLPLRGSSNQELVLFSDRYSLSSFEEQFVEITINPNNTTLTGFPIGIQDQVAHALFGQ